MLEKYEQTLQNWIEGIVESGDDDALFASGYLQGHFAVVLSQLEAEENQGLNHLSLKMQTCLDLAKEELIEQDYVLVEAAWGQLRHQIAA
ncbi:YfcL family protein [Shewanella surugensis]|uniref:YfcL family protein n=1 Tax=Shewanella surugensis TaxID=212020 RepID=A0ABT0LDD3_9GAMM|nr:YfcL family protein [Shewanella surugensis]MCL1125675.1 YfcL family protein [Shewanella surugensis]